MSTSLEGALLRIMASVGRSNDEKGPASVADVHEVINAVMGSSEFREQARLLSHLVQDAAIESRQETCRAVAILMLNRDPGAEPEPAADFVTATQTYAMLCVPTPGSKWKHHVDCHYKKNGAADVANVSSYMGVLLAAFEDLLNVQGHLLKTRPTAQQIQKIKWIPCEGNLTL